MPSPPDASHLLIPFAGRSTPDCKTALAALTLPNLDALLAKLTPTDTDAQGVDTLSPPHERAIAKALGLTAPDGRLPFAAREAARARLTAPAAGEGWAIVTLCHWDVAIDEVVLGDPAALGMDEVESQALLAAAHPFFEEDGIALYSSAQSGHWLARSALFEGMATASIDRAAVQPISAWQAGTKDQRVLRRLQNEMQMLLYTQRVNDDRTASGRPSINSFWLSGTGVLPENADVERAAPTVDLRLRGPALQDDGAAWAAAWQALDAGPIAQLRAAAMRGEAVTLTLCGDRAAQRWQPRAERLRCLAQKPVPPASRGGRARGAVRIVARDVAPRTVWALEQAGVHPLLARLYAARGVLGKDELDDGLGRLLLPDTLRGTREAAVLLADAIAADQRMCIVADYDCDGATACAVAVRGLRLLGAKYVSYLVPDRVIDGYGLTAPIAERVADSGADVLITVDNGIASVEGVAAAQARGLKVLVTDHHLPGPELPLAEVLVNPNQPGCGFESKSIAGVGVMFYVLLALRSELCARGVFSRPGAAMREGGSAFAATGSSSETTNLKAAVPQPKLDVLLPLVALGTVADVVKLDANNRRLVAQGLRRIRAGAMPVGIAALFKAAGRNALAATTFDFGFALGPRINAAGRLADMTLGIECLLTDDAARADELAKTLDGINRQRRDIEGGMRDQALLLAESLFVVDAGRLQPDTPPAISVFGADFHEGVVGIVASRLKDRFHRPTFVFAASGAPGKEAELKGSGRSIPGFHLRDALDLVAKRHPGVLLRFGGHAMAAGCTIDGSQFETFSKAIAQVAQEWLTASSLVRQIDTDGPLSRDYLRVELVDTLHREVWGQGFAPPTFSEEVEVVSQRLVGEKHLSLKLKHQGQPIDGIWFGHTEPLPGKVLLAFRLDADEWQGVRRVRFLVEGAEGS